MGAAFDLTTIQKVKDILSGSSPMTNADDALLTWMVTDLSRLMLRDMNRDTLLVQQYIEQVHGHGQTVFVPRQDQVKSIVSVVVRGISIPQSPDGIQSGWFLLDDGSTQRVFLVGYSFVSFGMVTYTAGYTTVPEDVEFACAKFVAIKYRERKRLGLSMEALPNGGGTSSYSQKDMPDDVRLVVEQYSLRF